MGYPYDALIAVLLLLAWFGLAFFLILEAIRFALPGPAWTPGRLVPLLATGAGSVICYLAMIAGFRTLDVQSVNGDFRVRKAGFDQIVAVAGRQRWEQGIHRVESGDSSASVDVSDAVRIELSTQGMFRNWEGFYYDPSDSYATGRANQFGGTVHGCRKIEGHYYYCSYDIETF